jgi:hypothetical protein
MESGIAFYNQVSVIHKASIALSSAICRISSIFVDIALTLADNTVGILQLFRFEDFRDTV